MFQQTQSKLSIVGPNPFEVGFEKNVILRFDPINVSRSTDLEYLVNILGFFPNLALVEYCTMQIQIMRGPSVVNYR